MSPRSVRRIPKHDGPAAWSEILGPVAARASLQGEVGCDIVIVGSGFAGLSAARRLRQIAPAARIVVVDAGRVAEGGAGRNSGFMIDLPHVLTSHDYAGGSQSRDRTLTSLNRQAIDFAGDAVTEYGISQGFFRRAGKINGAASEAGLAANRSYAAHLASLKEPHESLDAKSMQEITGTAHYRGGLYTPGTAMLQPAGYIRGLASGLERDGVAIFENSAVLHLESSGSHWILRTEAGSVMSSKVILATNGHLESFGYKRGRLMHIMLNACMTEALNEDQLQRLGGEENWGVTPSDPMGTTVRRIGMAQGSNRIIIRQGGCYRPDMQTRPGDLKRLVSRMRQKFEDRFPRLADVRFAYAWSGHLCLSKNGVSVMRELEPGLLSACVCNGLGTARGTLMGIAAAELACGRTSGIAAFFRDEEEPSKLPPHPVDTIAANAYMCWKEWLARAE